jgi:hypothetical protein
MDVFKKVLYRGLLREVPSGSRSDTRQDVGFQVGRIQHENLHCGGEFADPAGFSESLTRSQTETHDNDVWAQLIDLLENLTRLPHRAHYDYVTLLSQPTRKSFPKKTILMHDEYANRVTG